LSKNLVL